MSENEKNIPSGNFTCYDQNGQKIELTKDELYTLKEIISNYKHGEWLRKRLKSWGAWGVWIVSIITVVAVIRDTLIGWLSR